ncbi:MAG: hypothetical protein AAGJ35_15970, partial [Myxococcota bacterium]
LGQQQHSSVHRHQGPSQVLAPENATGKRSEPPDAPQPRYKYTQASHSNVALPSFPTFRCAPKPTPRVFKRTRGEAGGANRLFTFATVPQNPRQHAKTATGGPPQTDP